MRGDNRMGSRIYILLTGRIIPFEVRLDSLFFISRAPRACVPMDNLNKASAVGLLALAAHHEVDGFAWARADFVAVAHYCFHLNPPPVPTNNAPVVGLDFS